MATLTALLDAGGLSLYSAARRLGLTEAQALEQLVVEGRARRRPAAEVLPVLRTWGRVRVILRSGPCVVELMRDLGEVRESGGWWNHEDDHAHLHLDLRGAATAYLTVKTGHGSGRVVRMISIVDEQGEVLFKVMIPKERTELVAPFSSLRGDTP